MLVVLISIKLRSLVENCLVKQLKMNVATEINKEILL
jgi:hypothetical protein